MTVRKLKNKLIQLERLGHKDTEVIMFAHDHDDEKLDDGVGLVFSISTVIREDDSEIISLRP